MPYVYHYEAKQSARGHRCRGPNPESRIKNEPLAQTNGYVVAAELVCAVHRTTLGFVMHGFWGRPENVDVWGPGDPGGPETASNRWAATRPTGWKGLGAAGTPTH